MNLNTLTFEGHNIRQLTENDNPLFVAVDVARVLGFQNPSKSITRHVHPSDIETVTLTDSLGRTQKARAINESGLYCLIFGSKLPSAQKFKRWVTSEVLPSIRKTGQYGQAHEETALTCEAPINLNQANYLRLCIKNRCRVFKMHHSSFYHVLHQHFGVCSVYDIPADRFLEARFIVAYVPIMHGHGYKASTPTISPETYKKMEHALDFYNDNAEDMRQCCCELARYDNMKASMIYNFIRFMNPARFLPLFPQS